MWTLTQQNANLEHMNTRTEKHGDEHRLAVDLRISFTTGNDWLHHLDVRLKESLYERPDAPDLADTPEHMPRLRYAAIEEVRWSREWHNLRVTLHYGLLPDSDIVIGDARVNNMVIVPRDGGSVDIRFRVQFTPDTEQPEIIGRIAAMLEDRSIVVSVEHVPPAEPQQAMDNEPVDNPVEWAAEDDYDEDAGEEPPKKPRGRRRAAAVEAE